MESKDPVEAVQAAMAEEGYPEVQPDFALSEVDTLTRWVAAHSIEEALGVRIADERIQQARTVADLLDAGTERASGN